MRFAKQGAADAGAQLSCNAMDRTVCALQVGQLLMYVRISRSNRLLPLLTQIMALTQDCQCESCSPAV